MVLLYRPDPDCGREREGASFCASMVHRRPFRWSAALGALSCLACSSSRDSDAETGADDGAYDPIEFRVLTAKWVCEPLARCCSLSSEALGGEEGCIAAFVVASFESFTDLGNSIEDGRIAYDERRLRECIEESEQSSCDEVIAHQHPEACDSFLTPLVPLDGFCSIDADCIGGYCSESTCVATFAEDEPCSENSQCASLYCSDDEVCRPASEREPLACF